MGAQKRWTKPGVASLKPSPELAARLRTAGDQAPSAEQRGSLYRLADAISELANRTADIPGTHRARRVA